MFQLETIRRVHLKTLLSVAAVVGSLTISTLASAAFRCEDLFSLTSEATKPQARSTYQSHSPSGWSKEKLRIITFNAQDFTLYEKATSKLDRAEPKAEKHVKAIAKTLFENNPDIIVLQEIGNKYSLEKLVQLGAKDQYVPIFIQGNDGQAFGQFENQAKHGRHIGFLVKKSLNLQHTITTNLRIPYSGPERNRDFLFDRGLPVVTFYEPNNRTPLFVVIGVHNHSVGNEGKFVDLKSHEEQAMVDILQKIENTYGSNLPVILTGDFNLGVNEYGRLNRLRSKMIDSFDDLKIPSTDRRRVTQIFHAANRLMSTARQVDAVFINQLLANHIRNSSTLSFPIDDVSDHRPLMVDIDFDGIY